MISFNSLQTEKQKYESGDCMTKKKIKLGVLIQGPGSHPTSWRSEDAVIDGSINFNHYLNVTQKAEDAGFAFMFIADGLHINKHSIPHFLNRFEPMTLLSALAPVTSKIGLAGTVSTTYSEPYNVARQLASIDNISGGRAGWNVVTSPLEGSADNFNKGNHPEHSLRYRMASEYVEVVQGLWDSYEDDAFVRNRETGEFLDETKLHTLGYEGEFFKVKGPLNIQRSPQGQPVIFQAGASKTGQDFAAKYGEAIFTHANSIEKNREYYSTLKNKAIEAGRKAEDILIFPSLSPIIAPTEQEAEQRYEQIKNLISIDKALEVLGRFFDHYDFSAHPLDEPFPDIGEVGKNSFRSTTDNIKEKAEKEALTLREVALQVASPKDPFYGSYEDVASRMIEWIEEGAADGFMLNPQVFDGQFDEFIENVLPILEDRGYYERQYSGDTLRENLGLGFKENRYTRELHKRDKEEVK